MQTSRRRPPWALPLFSLALGFACLAAFWVGGDPQSGLLTFAVLAAFGLAILLGGRSETVRGLRGDGRDEYWQRLDLNATALSGLAVIVAVLAMCFWEWAHGRSGEPYVELGAIGGFAYLAAVVTLRVRG